MPAQHPPPPSWLYDYIMAQIEPDLTTMRLPLMDKAYQDESPQEREERIAHYEEVFSLFDAVLEDVMDVSTADARTRKEAVRRRLRQAEHTERSQDAAHAEQLFDEPGSTPSV